MKMTKKDIKEVFSDDENRKNYMKDVIALGILSKAIGEFNKYVQHIVISLSYEFENGEVLDAKLFFESLSVSKHSKVDKEVIYRYKNTGELPHNNKKFVGNVQYKLPSFY